LNYKFIYAFIIYLTFFFSLFDISDCIASQAESINLSRDVSGEGVQQALLKILEGTVSFSTFEISSLILSSLSLCVCVCVRARALLFSMRDSFTVS
jgi:hypothetical protein